MLMPPISRYMTRQPWTTAIETDLGQAWKLMREQQIRHLPVFDRERLVGVLSARTAELCVSTSGDRALTVGDAMMPELVIAQPEDAVDGVVEKMAELRRDAAVIVGKSGAVEGIFTGVDAMTVLVDVLRRATA